MQERHARDIWAHCTNSVSQHRCWFCLIVNQLLLHCTYKGLITWRISARAEISTRLTGLKFCCDYMTNFSPGWNISLGTKYEIARKESRENQAAILFHAFQPGLKFLFDYRRFFQPGAQFSPGWIPLHVINNLILRGFLTEAGLQFSM